MKLSSTLFSYTMLLIEDELQKTSKKAEDIDNEILIKQNLVFPSYSLPEGLYTCLFKLTVKDKGNSSTQYNPNINTVYINTKPDMPNKICFNDCLRSLVLFKCSYRRITR